MARTATQALPWMQSSLDLEQKCVHLDTDDHAKLSAVVEHYNKASGSAPLSLGEWLGAVIACRFDMMIANGEGTEAI